MRIRRQHLHCVSACLPLLRAFVSVLSSWAGSLSSRGLGDGAEADCFESKDPTYERMRPNGTLLEIGFVSSLLVAS
jgi:hypothetical protein